MGAGAEEGKPPLTLHGPDAADQVPARMPPRTAKWKYRHWFRGRVGIDFGFEFIDGTDPESFADEHRLLVSFGVIF